MKKLPKVIIGVVAATIVVLVMWYLFPGSIDGVVVDDEKVESVIGGNNYRVFWKDLNRVFVVIADPKALANDNLYSMEPTRGSGGTTCQIPFRSARSKDLIGRLYKLPGFNKQNFEKAQQETRPGEYLVWQRIGWVFEKTFVKETASCSADKPFKVILAGDTQATDEEEKSFGFPYVWIQQGAPLLGLTPKAYDYEISFVDPKRFNANSRCNGTLAFPIGENETAILLSLNNRPQNDKLAIIVYNSAQHKILAVDDNLGIYGSLNPLPDGFAFEVNDQPSDFGGKQGIEEYNFTHWLKVRYVNGKIVKTEDPKLTWEKSKWKSFFASENEFAKGFKFDSQANTFSVAWVYKKGNCIQPSVERAFDEAARWICKSPS